MCFFKVPKPEPPVIPPAITPTVDTNTELPTKKDLVDPEEKVDVEYGSKKKEAGPAAGQRGTDQLKIPLNPGGGGEGAGGINQ